MRNLRWVLQHPGYISMAAATLALAVGANLVVFTIVNALWLRPPAFVEPDRVVIVLGDTGEAGSTDSAVFAVLDHLERSMAFGGVAGQVTTSGPSSRSFLPRIRLQEIGQDVETLAVTSDYFKVLGLPILGRDFVGADDQAGAEPVAIISHRLWTEKFQGRAALLDTLVPAEPFGIRIIGVAPPGFQGTRLGERADAWIARGLVSRISGIDNFPPPLMAIARLREGITVPEAERLLAATADPQAVSVGQRFRVVPIADVFGTPNSKTIVVRERNAAALVGSLAGLVLLAGAATLMALVLIHYERRRQELSLRLALGASRARLSGRLATELMLLVACGGSGATMVAVSGLRALPALSLPGGVDLARLDLSLDWRVLVAALVLSSAMVALAALVPIRRFTQPRLAHDLPLATGTPTLASHRIRRTLLAAQVGLTVIVLMSAALFVRAVLLGFTDGAGFDVNRTAFIRLQVVSPFVSSEDDVQGRSTRIVERTRVLTDSLNALPGVIAVSPGPAPLGPEAAVTVLSPRTIATDNGERSVRVAVTSAGSEYLKTLGVPTILGRSLTSADAAARPTPAVVTESLARSLWPGQTPLGQRLSLSGRGGNFTTVGVVSDFRFGSLSSEPLGVVSATERHGAAPEFVIRTSQPERLAESVKQLVATVVPEARGLEIVSGRELVARDLGRQRLGAWFFSGLASWRWRWLWAVCSGSWRTWLTPAGASSASGSRSAPLRAI